MQSRHCPMNTKILYVLPLLGIALAGCHPKDDMSNEVAAPKVTGSKIELPPSSPQVDSLQTASAEVHPALILRVNGRLLWDDGVTVRMFSPFAGRVSQINAEAGKKVSQGDTLARVISPDYGQTQAEARKAAADLLQADRTLTRLNELLAYGAAARKDVEAAEADLARAKSERDRTVARLSMYGGNSSSDQVYEFKSPLDGVIVERNLNPGQEVRPDQMLANAPQLCAPLFVITDPSKLWIQLDATEQDLPYLKPGMEFVLRTHAFPDKVFRGKIDVVSDSLDPATRTVKVRGSVDNSERLLKAEMFVTVDVEAGQTKGLDVSAKSIYLKGDKHFLFLEESRGQYVRREVTVGGEHDGKILVTAGLQPGEKVVTNGCLLLDRMVEDGTGS